MLVNKHRTKQAMSLMLWTKMSIVEYLKPNQEANEINKGNKYTKVNAESRAWWFTGFNGWQLAKVKKSIPDMSLP